MAIGGYFELELKRGNEYHCDAIRLNSGVSAVEYILRVRGYKEVHLPYYTCDSLLLPIERLGLTRKFYRIDDKLEPIIDYGDLRANSVVLLINYFGLKSQTMESVAARGIDLIVDNAQAFFTKPLAAVDTFYSPRKFFGVPDGCYLYATSRLQHSLEADVSHPRLEHLLRRLEHGPENGYPYYRENEDKVKHLPLRTMSVLTRRLLQNIDYAEAANRRLENYRALEHALAAHNQLHLEWDGIQVPLVYPFYPRESGLREYLLSNHIYTARYWPYVLRELNESVYEYQLADRLIPLPVDQRYNLNDMQTVIASIKTFLRL